MDYTLSYPQILKQVIQDAVQHQPRLQAIQLHPICDPESGHFLILAIGWHNEQRLDTILFHAHLSNQQIIIETDNFEDSLTQHLINHGVPIQDLITPPEPTRIS
jgi:XisI protein